MSSFEVQQADKTRLPARLFEIPQPPKTLTYRGTLPSATMPLISIVGSRKYSTYGKQVVESLCAGLRNHNVGIVSGLALGIDSLAHEAALKNNLYTLAIPGSGLDDAALYPRSHVRLAKNILAAGGGLLSEFNSNFRATKWSFIQRNRLMAGIAHATLVIEATEQSGTLTTARMCADYNRELCVVPGNIFSQNSAGPHLFLKLGATPITSAQDLIDLLGLQTKTPTALPLTDSFAAGSLEQRILVALIEPLTAYQLQEKLQADTSTLNQTLMLLEIKGKILAHNGLYQRNV